MYQGTFIDPQYQQIDRLIENIRSPHATSEMQRRQLDFLQKANAEHRAQRLDPRLEARIQSFELAFRMQTEAAEAFDVSSEPQHIREHVRHERAWPANADGAAASGARRALRATVARRRTAVGPSQQDRRAISEDTSNDIDQPIAALLTDLKQRGMFDDTLVIWGGEFGRTPTSEGDSGRDHNHYGFSVWMAGGGIRGGTVHGATDDFGFKAVEKPASVHDLHATILHLLGFDHERLTYRYAGRDFRLTDVSGEVIREILA